MSVDEVLHGEGRRRTRFNFDLATHDPWIVAVSHCHLSDDHPDPTGKQLLRLMEVIETERKRTDRPGAFPSSTGGDYAVFFSWCSLYQPEEAVPVDQDEAATIAMDDIDLWFTHRLCRLVVLDVPAGCGASCEPRAARGWPHFELAVHSLLRHTVHGLRVPLPIYALPCRPHVLPPHSASAFADLLKGKSFALEAERAHLIKVYSGALERVLTCAELLHFAGCGWGDEECELLSEVLPKCLHAKSLNLSRNLKITDAGIEKIAAALVVPGAAPRLREINLQHIPYGLAAKLALEKVSKVRDVMWYV